MLYLPLELRLSIVSHLRDIEDLVNLTSTCRELHALAVQTPPNTILRLAAEATCIFFRPSPHFLIAAVAEQLGRWAAKSESQSKARNRLCQAFLGGSHGLLDLCVEVCGMTMKDSGRLHRLRTTTLNPINDLSDKIGERQAWKEMARMNSYQTVEIEPSETLFHLAIYSGLFKPAMDACLRRKPIPEALDIDTRLEILKYCCPDWIYWRGQLRMDEGRDYIEPAARPRRAVQEVGLHVDDHTMRHQHQNQDGAAYVL